VSRPGDTVIVYFSGHGLKVDGKNGPEYHLAPYDHLGAAEINVLLRQLKEDQLNAERDAVLKSEAEQLQKIAESYGAEGVMQIMRQRTITRGDFVNWLRMLDGRQIIVVLDACHSGGFSDSSGAKDLIKSDFLDDDVSRLKDLGQRDIALLVACSAEELSRVRQEQDLSVMTYFLVEAIERATGPLTLEEGYQYCAARMKEYFAGRPQENTHEPHLSGQSSRPALLRP
jgi:hypothetical protein